MYCIVKDSKTFRSCKDTTCSVTDYTLTADTIYDETSDITVTGPKDKPKEGDIIVLENGFMGVVQEAEQSGRTAGLKCRQMATLFGRETLYIEPQAGTLEERLKALIDAHYTNQPDELYRLPYLKVIAETATTGAAKPDLDDNGLFSVSAYMAKLRRLHDIFVTFEPKREQLVVRIARRNVPLRHIDFSDPGLRLTEQSFSREQVGKITTIAEDTGASTDWYLLADGTVTNRYTAAGRAAGEWRFLPVREAAGAEEAARDEFLSNTYSHKIAFEAAREKARYRFGDRVLLSLDGRLFRSYIAVVRRRKGSAMTEYECGELRTTYPLKELL